VGTILGTFTSLSPSSFIGRRATTWGFVVGWWKSHWVSTGRISVLQEELFGGYRLHITFKANVWDWSSNHYSFGYLLEDFYVTAPGSSIKISAGAVTVRWGIENKYVNPVCIYALASAGQYYYFQQFPTRPGGYWASPLHPTPTSPFEYKVF